MAIFSSKAYWASRRQLALRCDEIRQLSSAAGYMSIVVARITLTFLCTCSTPRTASRPLPVANSSVSVPREAMHSEICSSLPPLPPSRPRHRPSSSPPACMRDSLSDDSYSSTDGSEHGREKGGTHIEPGAVLAALELFIDPDYGLLDRPVVCQTFTQQEA